MPLDLLPWDVLPGHLQGGSLCFGALPLTHRFTFQHTGSTSAYPGHYPRRLLLRASSSPAASGWHLLWIQRATERLLRSPSPLLEPLGRRYPPGFVTVPTGQSDGCQRRILCRFGSSVSASYAGLQSRWLNHVFAFAAHRFLRSERSGCGSQISPFIPAATR